MVSEVLSSHYLSIGLAIYLISTLFAKASSEFTVGEMSIDSRRVSCDVVFTKKFCFY